MMLKLAELTLRPTDEALPKVVIHLPPTPINEQPPTIPVNLNKNKAPIKQVQQPVAKLDAGLPTGLAKIRLPSSKGRQLSAAITTPTSTSITPKSVINGAKKKAKTSLKSQTRGMSNMDMRACRNALKRLLAHKNSLMFRLPVDPVRDRAFEYVSHALYYDNFSCQPSYFDVIKSPMDLSTIGAKLESGAYTDGSKFEADFHLMISNAKEYNANGSFVYNEAVALNSFFEKRE
jgi:transcription initiation factor TFIID subunit 2